MITDEDLILARWIQEPSEAHTTSLRPEHFGRRAALAKSLQTRGSTMADHAQALASSSDPTGMDAYSAMLSHAVGLLPSQVIASESRIKHKFSRIAAERAASAFLTSIRSGKGSISGDIHQLQAALAEAESQAPSQSRAHSEVAAEVFSEWAQSLQAANADDQSARTLPMAWECLQRATGGWAIGKLHIVGGRSSEHKTTFARQSAAFLASKGIPVCYHTAEDSDHDISGRTLAAASRSLNTRMLMHGTGPYDTTGITGDGLAVIMDDVKQSMSGPVGESLRIVDVPHPRLSQLLGIIKVEASKGCRAFFFDFLQLCLPDKGLATNDWWRFCVASLAGLAKQLKIAIVCTSQIEKTGTQASQEEGRVPRGDEMPNGAVLRQGAFGVIMVGTRQGPGGVSFIVEIDKFKSAENVRVSGKQGIEFDLDPAHDRITERKQ